MSGIFDTLPFRRLVFPGTQLSLIFPQPTASLDWNLVMVTVALDHLRGQLVILTSLEGLELARKGYGGWVFGEVGEDRMVPLE